MIDQYWRLTNEIEIDELMKEEKKQKEIGKILDDLLEK